MSHIYKWVRSIGAVLVLAGIVAVQADEISTSKLPLDQAKESLDKNLEKSPDNKGLKNASERVEENQQRILNKRAERLEGVGEFEKPEKPERPERAEKLERPERFRR